MAENCRPFSKKVRTCLFLVLQTATKRALAPFGYQGLDRELRLKKAGYPRCQFFEFGRPAYQVHAITAAACILRVQWAQARRASAGPRCVSAHAYTENPADYSMSSPLCLLAITVPNCPYDKHLFYVWISGTAGAS
jgi:hypothetical protein